MNSRIFFTLLFALVALVSGRCEDAPETPRIPPQPPLSRAGLGALEHASKLVVAINALDWKIVDSAAPKKEAMLPFLRRDAALNKDWHGIGAYRGFDNQQDRRTLIHKFTYGPNRTTPHEVWFIYTLDGDTFTFDEIAVLGW